MLIPILLFVLGLILLIKGGDWFVDGAAGIAAKFNVPDILIGATVVSIGTTLPEVMVSANSALSGHGEIAYGNAIGSIICNTALIAGVTIAVKPSTIDRKALKTPVIYFFTAATFYAMIAYINKGFTRITGVLLMAIFLIYMVTTVKTAFAEIKTSGIQTGDEKNNFNNGGSVADTLTDPDKNQNTDTGDINRKDKPDDKADEETDTPVAKLVVLLILGAVLIAVGADLLVDNGTLIAEGLGVPESVIALTFVALGTSLPELVTAITSLVKGHGALSLGNICGANLFNLVLVSGVSILLAPFSIPAGKTIAIGGKDVIASLVVDIPVMLTVMLILTVPALLKGRMSRAQGIVLLIIYFTFTIFQFAG
ncbi:MAG: calcium/sodium antiporter [Lachnospiraceae bacterium]|nr:calcium/sodium antiporter [Lachnospiraceae bacterium]